MELPYPAREGQHSLIQFLQTTPQIGIAEASTGSGKTIAALVAAYNRAKGPILIATRTNSQQRQFLREVQQLKESGQDVGLVVPLMGRKQYCPHLATDPDLASGTAEEWGRLCRRAKQLAETGAGGCKQFAKLKQEGTGPVEAVLRETVPNHEAFLAKTTAAGICPYEAVKELLPKADVVLLPAIFLIDHGLRANLHNWLGRNPNDCTVILDEAHHIPDSARRHYGSELGTATLQRAAKEAPGVMLAGRYSIRNTLHAIRAMLLDATEFLTEHDGRVPSGWVPAWLMNHFKAPSTAIEAIAMDLSILGEQIREEKEKQGKLPRSSLGSVGDFLRQVFVSGGETATIIKRSPEERLELALLDSASALDWQSEYESVLHMSGTLTPIPLHAALCGVPEAAAFQNTAPPKGLQLYCMQGVHRKWKAFKEDPTLAARHQELAEQFLAHVGGRAALMFPSHAMLQDYLEEGFLYGHPHLFIESAQMSTPALTEMAARFSAGPANGVLLAVLGGRLSEGIDFPGDALTALCVMGVPYPKPSAKGEALQDYLERKHPGQGWNLAVQVPVGRVMRQAIGRLIRSPDDQGVALILDERGVRFRAQLPPMRDIHSLDEIGVFPEESGFKRGGTTTIGRES